MVKAHLYIIIITTFLLVDKATSIPSTFIRSLSFQLVKDQPFLPNSSNSSSTPPKHFLSRSSTMSEIENKEELPLPLSETSLYSTCHINSSKTQENSTTAACADVEDVENDGLKKWELIAWDEYKKWFKVAENKRNELLNARKWKLRLAITGAVLQTISSQVPAALQVTRLGTLFHSVQPSNIWWVNIEIPSRRILSTVGAICLGALPIMDKTVLNEENMAARVDSRVISEMLDSEIQKSLARVGPYRERDANATVKFIDSILKIEEMGTHISPERALSIEESQKGVGVGSGRRVSRWNLPRNFRSAKKVDTRKLPECNEDCRDYKERYLKLRLEPIIEKRLKSAKKLEGLSIYYKGWETKFQIGAALLGLINGSNGSNYGVWITAMLSAAGSLGTHIHSNQIDKQAGDLYSLVVTPLKHRLKKRARNIVMKGEESPDDWDAFVEECEEILLAQTMSWSTHVLKGPENSDQNEEGAPKSQP